MKLLYTYIPFQILVGVLLGILFPENNTYYSYGLYISVFLLSILFLSIRKYKNTGIFILLIVLGFLSAKFSVYITSDLRSKEHYTHSLKKVSTLKLIVVKELGSTQKQFKYYARVIGVNSKPSCGTLLVVVYKDNKCLNKLEVGDEFVCKTRILPIKKANSTYDFDYRKYLKKKGVYGKITIKDFVITGYSTSGLLSIQQLRNRVLSKLEASILSENSKGLLMAMLLGSRDYLSKEVMVSFRNAGVVHLIAISGMHVGVLYFILLYGFNFVKNFKYGNFLHVCIVVSCLWFFAVFSGLSTSVVRAVTMFSFILLSRLKDRNGLLLEPIVSSMLFLLIIHPNYLFDVGFQLSYAAVISIVVFYPLVAKRINIKNRVVKYFTDVVIVSIVAQIGVLPITLYYFHQIPLQFLITNFIAVSLLPIVLYGGIVVLLKILWTKEFLFIEAYFDVFLSQYIQTIQSFSSLEFLIIKDIVLTEVHVGCYYLILILVWNLFQKSSSKNWVLLFMGIICFQIVHVFYKYKIHQKEELLIYNHYNNQAITIKKANTLFVFSDTILHARIHQNKIKNGCSEIVKVDSKVVEFKQERFVVVDDSFDYDKVNNKGMSLILFENPRVNLERLIRALAPKQIIIGRGNYRNNVLKWKSTCKNLQVPFYDVDLQGSYRIN